MRRNHNKPSNVSGKRTLRIFRWDRGIFSVVPAWHGVPPEKCEQQPVALLKTEGSGRERRGVSKRLLRDVQRVAEKR
jgi:hypothetical protein